MQNDTSIIWNMYLPLLVINKYESNPIIPCKLAIETIQKSHVSIRNLNKELNIK